MKGERIFLTEEEARARRDKKKLEVKEMWYRHPLVKRRRQRNQKGFLRREGGRPHQR